MNTRITVGSILILMTCVLQSYSQQHEIDLESNSEQQMKFEHFGRKYAALQGDWKKKRLFCLELIDKKVIGRGVLLRDVVEIFGKDTFRAKGNINSECIVSIHFEKQDEYPGDETISIGFTGWYLRIYTSTDGKIVNYYLSNLHK